MRQSKKLVFFFNLLVVIVGVKQVLYLGDETLRKPSEPVFPVRDEDFPRIKQDLRDTLVHLQKEYGTGRALAAPQIGYMKQVIYCNYGENSFYLVNPQILSESPEDFQVWDSCFSFKMAFFVKIARSRQIRLEYLTEKGKKVKNSFSGEESELLQHEIDHLRGTLAVDHLQSPKDLVLREIWEQRYKQ